MKSLRRVLDGQHRRCAIVRAQPRETWRRRCEDDWWTDVRRGEACSRVLVYNGDGQFEIKEGGCAGVDMSLLIRSVLAYSAR